MTLPWPIVAIESRGGTWVRITHADGMVADHDFAYLLGRTGVFAELSAEMISEVNVLEGGAIGWVLADAVVVDLAPDALRDHAMTGACPGTCRGWTPAHTVLVRHETVGR